MKKNCKKQISKHLEQKQYLKEKVINYFIWKGYDNSFNAWINKKRFGVILLNAVPLYKNE